MEFLRIYFNQSMIGFFYVALFLVTITLLKIYPRKFLPKFAARFQLVLNIIIILVTLLFYGLWAAIAAVFIQQNSLGDENVITKILLFIFSNVTFIAILIFLEFIRLRKKEFIDSNILINPQYLVYSIITFQVFIIRPDLLKLLVQL